MFKQTASQTVGPYFHIGLIDGKGQNNLVTEGTVGERIRLIGTVFDGEGQAIPDALIEIWQPDAYGIFNHPSDPLHEQADPHFRGFGRAENSADGMYEFRTIKPGGRDRNAPFISVFVFARGLLIHTMTRLYFEGESTNATDPVLTQLDNERQATLIAKQAEGVPLTYCFNIHLQGEQETVFFQPY
jgi:protocatechuate 3,4-dioxygenase alpha subunit